MRRLRTVLQSYFNLFACAILNVETTNALSSRVEQNISKLSVIVAGNVLCNDQRETLHNQIC